MHKKRIPKYHLEYPKLSDIEDSNDINELDLPTFTYKLNHYLQTSHAISKNDRYYDDYESLKIYKEWDAVFLYIKRYLRSQYALIYHPIFQLKGYSKRLPVTLEEYITIISDYASNICKEPLKYWNYFNQEYSCRLPATFCSSAICLRLGQEGCTGTGNGNDIDICKQIADEVTKIETYASIVDKMGEIYAVIKLYHILRRIRYISTELWPCVIRYTHTDYKIQYKDVFTALPEESIRSQTSLQEAVTRQLFSIAKSMNEIYNSGHIFTVYMHSSDDNNYMRPRPVRCVRKLVDTNNNLYMPMMYKLSNDQVDEINKNEIVCLPYNDDDGYVTCQPSWDSSSPEGCSASRQLKVYRENPRKSGCRRTTFLARHSQAEGRRKSTCPDSRSREKNLSKNIDRNYDHMDFEGNVHQRSFHIIHNGQGNFMFRVDEYLGDELHHNIKVMNYPYISTKPIVNGKCIEKYVNHILPVYGKKPMYNRVYQYLDLFHREEKDRLYGYIYDTPEFENLAIHYLLVDIYNHPDDQVFRHPDDSFQKHPDDPPTKRDICTLTTMYEHMWCGGRCLRLYPHLKREGPLPEIKQIDQKQLVHHIFYTDFSSRSKKTLPFDCKMLTKTVWNFSYGVNEEFKLIPGFLYERT